MAPDACQRKEERTRAKMPGEPQIDDVQRQGRKMPGPAMGISGQMQRTASEPESNKVE
ncbi:MAG: hypothetical protein ACLTLQ_03410 [[Clostridium] scindens]